MYYYAHNSLFGKYQTLQDLKSRVIRICRSILPLFRLWLYLCVWVWAEAEASPASPPTLLPIHHFYLCLCRLDYTSLPILPFMPLLLRFPLSSGNLPISWKLASISWNCSHLGTSAKYKPHWFPNFAPDLTRHYFQHVFVTSLHTPQCAW